MPEDKDPNLAALERELEAAQQQLGDPVAKAKRVEQAKAALEAYRQANAPDGQPSD